MEKAIAYYRVSTEQQGRSGLSLEAQQKAVSDFAKSNSLMLAEEFVEIRSSRSNQHFNLKAALAECKKQRAVLIIAKLDRLSRNVAFIAALMDAKDVQFKVVDNPHADKIILHIIAVFAQYEREQISKRTSAALQAAKRKGTELGKNGKYVLSKRNKIQADMFAISMQPLIEKLKANGYTTIRAIASELNRKQVATYSDNSSRWHPTTVHQLLKRIKRLQSHVSNSS